MTTTATPPSKEFLMNELAAEYKELLELCRQLTPEEWNTPSLCTGWSVRDVVAHLIGTQTDALLFFTSGGPNRANQKMVERRQQLTIAQLTDQLAAITDKPKWLTKLIPTLYIDDTWVHQQDIRWVLGADRQRTQKPERVKIVLNAFSKVALKRFPTVQFTTTDTDWQVGTGQTVRGTAEAVAMALARRPAALKRLEGDGVATLSAKIK